MHTHPYYVGICISKTRFLKGRVCFNHVLKGPASKGKKKLPIGKIFFPLRVTPMRIENNSKGKLN